MKNIEEIMRDFIQILNLLDIDYVIIGGIAVNCWGNIRTTRDIDVIIDLKDIGKFVKKLEEKGFKVKIEDIEKALQEKSHFTIFDEEYLYHIDVKGAYSKREKESLKTKKDVKIDDFVIYISSPEDTIANKLLYGSEQDIKDAESIYIRQKEKIDFSYLEKRCKELDVYEEYKEMVKKIREYIN
ncbi:MAG TPA: hypothetical protein ENI52_05470 [Thermoplasmata archaeon]|nr:hypothetical protein [Thermoplasmata archaeon]